MSLTTAQQKAISARGNVLVVAGAGTGKTRTLVERCLNCLLEGNPPASLEEILMVTFTEAAAAEMRQRIRERLEEALKAEEGTGSPESRDARRARHLREQLALFEPAHIGTLHSFCLELVRQHFYELELDPQLSVLADEEARLLADETLETVLQRHYAGGTRISEAVQQLIQTHGRGWDKPIRALVLRLHHYTQTRADPRGWFAHQLARYAAPEPTEWAQWRHEAIADWRQRWLPVLERSALGNPIAEKCAAALRRLRTSGQSRGETLGELPPPPIRWGEGRGEGSEFDAIMLAATECPKNHKGAWLKPLEKFLEETEFLASLMPAAKVGRVTPCAPPDPLVEDWNWVRLQMTTLLELAREFADAFTEAKRELGMADFHDLEQCALKLLWDARANAPTRIALEWRQRLRFIFVDEYQDINRAQDKIIAMLSRDGPQANRFLVGDVKQSIYRFRLAEPSIFRGYIEAWKNGRGEAIPLVDNFRSREGILSFINSLFTAVMGEELDGVKYDETAALRFAAVKERGALGITSDPGARVELHLRVKSNQRDEEQDDETQEELNQLLALGEAEKEARMVALRLRELKAERHLVWDDKMRGFRPVEWSDIAILLRSPANKTEAYAKEFLRLEVPLQVERGEFYQSLEVSDLLSLLQLLDNPLQDLPLLAVLRSPLVGLTLDELATVRLTARGPFWTALARWHESEVRKSQAQTPKSRGKTEKGTRDTQYELAFADHRRPTLANTQRKVAAFLDRYRRWRRLARQASLSRCLEAVLSETHYGEWLLTQPQGEQRHANVQRLLAFAQQFDQFQRQSLFRFLCFVEAQRAAEAEPEVASVSDEKSVRLMSIHQSKGLEFPVVVLVDLGKAFNEADLRAEIILDERYGLCPQIKPPHTGQRYPSLPYWLARRRQLVELLGEESRLLYVAATRARDTLILSGTVSKARLERFWNRNGSAEPGIPLTVRSYADWLGYWLSRNCASPEERPTHGQNEHLRWMIHDDTELARPGAKLTPEAAPTVSADDVTSETWQKLQQRLAWQYPFLPATRRPAKTSVSILRRRAAEQLDDETAPAFAFHVSRFTFPVSRFTPHASSSASAIGSAHHRFLERVALEQVGSLKELKGEAHRLVQEVVLTEEETALLDLEGLVAFWQSELGQKVLAQRAHVRRELEFTARFSPAELAALTGEPSDPGLEGEFVVVQGIADLAVVLPQEIWLVDFKTDRVEEKGVAERVAEYEPQLKLYARALSRIYRRPVSECWLYFLMRRMAVPIKTG